MTATGSLSQPSRSNVDQQRKPLAQNRGPRSRTELGIRPCTVHYGQSGKLAPMCAHSWPRQRQVRLTVVVVPAGGSAGLQVMFVCCRKQASTGRPEEADVRAWVFVRTVELCVSIGHFYLHTSQPLVSLRGHSFVIGREAAPVLVGDLAQLHAPQGLLVLQVVEDARVPLLQGQQQPVVVLCDVLVPHRAGKQHRNRHTQARLCVSRSNWRQKPNACDHALATQGTRW